MFCCDCSAALALENDIDTLDNSVWEIYMHTPLWHIPEIGGQLLIFLFDLIM
jgi:hypothetical protein